MASTVESVVAAYLQVAILDGKDDAIKGVSHLPEQARHGDPAGFLLRLWDGSTFRVTVRQEGSAEEPSVRESGVDSESD